MATYKNAIYWITRNDDTEWVDGDSDDGSGAISVTAALVADLFNKTDEQVRKDIKRELKKRDTERKDRDHGP